MHIDITPEAILAQLGYPKSDTLLKQMERVIKNTHGFDKFSKHIFSLNDFLKHVYGFVALSNSKDYLKIKCKEEVSKELVDEFHEKIDSWSKKYKVKIEKVPNKETYYILGIED
ncbi:MAG: hypothetical protein QG567_77 [Campylobacterota bacterium]|nr:hypothetical protein [Campylobacterota bacterium]